MLKKISFVSSLIVFLIKIVLFFYVKIVCAFDNDKILKKITLANKLKSLFLYKKNKSEVTPLLTYKNIHVFIISFNNLNYLKQIIKSLEKYQLTNIHIVDNNSDYPPLLDYLNNSPYEVHRMEKNWGHKVLWISHKFDNIISKLPYIVTDPDIELSNNLPHDFIQILYKILAKYDYVTKVGFALKINDIPDVTIHSNVNKWESQFWKYKIEDDLELYKADIDTTFALYRPGFLSDYNFYNGIRIAGNFSARHLPWYKNTEEQEYYEKTSLNNISHTNKWKKNGII